MAGMIERERPSVPVPEGSEPKEVFAFFGLSAFCAQVLERGIINIVVGLHLRRVTSLSKEEVLAAFDRIEKRTLGQLMADMRNQGVRVSRQLEIALKDVLESRNYLMHQFFAVHDIDFMSELGRTEMIAELRAICMRFQRCDRALDKLSRRLWNRLGLTDELLSAALAEMKTEAAERDRLGARSPD